MELGPHARPGIEETVDLFGTYSQGRYVGALDLLVQLVHRNSTLLLTPSQDTRCRSENRKHTYSGSSIRPTTAQPT